MITNGQFNPNVPIIGEPFRVEGAFLHVVLRCKCKPAGQEEILVVIGLPGQMRVQCATCKKVYILAAMGKQFGEFQWAIGHPREDAEQAAEASSAS